MHSVFIKIGTTLFTLILFITFIVFIQHKPSVDIALDFSKEGTIKMDNLYVAALPASKYPVPDFSQYTNVKEKKKAFFAYLIPEIQRQNFIVLKERKMVLALYEMASNKQEFSAKEQEVFNYLLKKYKLTSDKKQTHEFLLSKLIRRVDVIPEELVLVQAANESGWGTSRFAKQGYNFFGLWCFKKGCGFVPSRRLAESKHEVAKFKDLSHAVMTYIRNLNRLYAYQELRDIRISLRRQSNTITAEELVVGLSKYSERGQAYIDELSNMIRVNKKFMRIER